MNDPNTVIEIKASLASTASWQTVSAAILFLSGIVFSHYFDSEAVIASGVAAVAAVLTFGVTAYKAIKSHDTKVALANMLPDSVAVVK